MKEKELQTLTQQGKFDEAMELLEEARFHRKRMKEYALSEPREFIEKFINIAVLKVIYHDMYFGKTAYYIPDPFFYVNEIPILIDHDYDGENGPCYTVEIFSKEAIEKDLQAFFYKELYKWIINTGDPLYVWLMDNIKKTVEVGDYLSRVEKYSLYTHASNLTDERFRDMLKWSLAFEMYTYLLRFGYYEQIKRRMNLIHHKLNLKPIISPVKSIIIEKLGLLGDEYFEFDYWDDDSRKQYLQEKLLDLVQPEKYLTKGLHLLLFWYCYTDDLIKAARKTFPEWFAES